MIHMINKWVDSYANFMINTFGYDVAVRIEDILYGAGMFVLGDFGRGKLRLLRYDNGKKSTQFVQVKNLWSAFRCLFF